MDEAPRPPRDVGGTDRLDPVTLADALLLALDRGLLAAVDVAPLGEGHRLRGERQGQAVELGALTRARGEALAARLALLAGVDLAGVGEQLGRIRTRVPARDAAREHLVGLREIAGGRAVEVRALLTEAFAPAATEHGENRSLGTYTLLEEIGRGGMGVVYRGEHATLQKPVAIKVLHHGVISGAEAATRLIMEARAACRARHPGIVDVTDIGRLPDGRTFLVMELIEAPTLDVILANGPLSPARVLHVASQVTSALEAASAAGVVHRDIKPGNLFLLPDDRVKVGDFGVARVGRPSVEPLSSDGLVGTPWYMAPEQADGREADTRSDLYALGVVMFEALTGRVPFDGERPADILAAHLTQPVGRLIGPGGFVVARVAGVVHHALEKAPEDRYQTPAEMRAALEDAARMLAAEGAE